MTNHVTIRDLSEADIPHILNYWFHSPPGFVESMGVDLTKLPTEVEMKETLTKKIRANAELSESKASAVVILLDGKPVGVHTLFPYTEGESGIFHAHVWNKADRRKGIGRKSYPLACRLFTKRFGLQKIVFKTPLQNEGAIKVKEKLGIRHVGEERIAFGIMKENTLAKVFEVTAEELKLNRPPGPAAALDINEPFTGFEQDGEMILWFTRRLWDLSKDLPVFQYEVASFECFDKDVWFGSQRKPTVAKVLEHYRKIEKADFQYPIILSSSGAVLDGVHRICRAHLDGRRTVTAVRFEVDPQPDRRYPTTNVPSAEDAEWLNADLCGTQDKE